MLCPNCHSPMTGRTVVTEDRRESVTNWLCSACCKRVIHREPNKVQPLEFKMASPTVVGNPHKRRIKIPTISTVDIPITQDELDQKL